LNQSIKSIFRLAVAAVAACTILAPAAEGAVSSAAGLETVTAQGVGTIKLGASLKSLHRRHLVGQLRPGCELDPGQRVARLRPPLVGFAIFHRKRLSSLGIRSGAETALDIGIGSKPFEAKQAYPGAEYFAPGQADPFEEGFFWVNNTAHPKFTFTVDAQSHLITEISVPSPAFCE
jgi:hypothetical protein